MNLFGSMKSGPLVGVALMVTSLGVVPPAYGAPGDLDTSFGSGGKVLTSFGDSLRATGISMGIQPDGKIVVAGLVEGADWPHPADFAVARYDTNGSLDASFGTDGKVTTDFMGGDDFGYSVAIQADGKIVVAGSASDGSGEHTTFAVARYDQDGSLDTSFGTAGKVMTDFPAGNAEGWSVAIQADGKIVVAGNAEAQEDPYCAWFAVARYGADGSLDSSFGTGGRVTTDFPGTCAAKGWSVAIQADGMILVVGEAADRFALARYKEDGSPDTSFGKDGRVTTYFRHYASGYSVAIQTDGKIVVAGVATFGDLASSFAVARYRKNGSLDRSFGRRGKITTKFCQFHDNGSSVAIQTDGKIVVAGSACYQSIAVARYGKNGFMDRSFGRRGKVTTESPEEYYNVYGYSVAIQADGKIVVAGAAKGEAYDFVVVRYLATAGGG